MFIIIILTQKLNMISCAHDVISRAHDIILCAQKLTSEYHRNFYDKTWNE